MKKIRRKKMLIYPRFQLRLILINIIVMFTFIIGVGILIYFSYNNLYQQGITANLNHNHPYFGFIDYQFKLILTYVAIGIACGVAVSSVISLFLSHKVAGPYYRLFKYFEEIERTGKIDSKIQFRRGDFFTELPTLINSALDNLTKPSS